MQGALRLHATSGDELPDGDDASSAMSLVDFEAAVDAEEAVASAQGNARIPRVKAQYYPRLLTKRTLKQLGLMSELAVVGGASP